MSQMTIIRNISVNNDLHFGVSRKKENDMAFIDMRLCKCWQFPCLEWTIAFNHDSCTFKRKQSRAHKPALLPTHLSDVFRSWSKSFGVHTTLTASVYPFKSSPWEHDLITLYDTLKGHGNIYRMDFQSARRGWLSWVIWITKSSMHGSNPCTDGNAAERRIPSIKDSQERWHAVFPDNSPAFCLSPHDVFTHALHICSQINLLPFCIGMAEMCKCM